MSVLTGSEQFIHQLATSAVSNRFSKPGQHNLSFVWMIAVSLLAVSSPSFAAELLDETKAAVQEWVQTEQLISQENRQWREEKSSIEDLLNILDAERRVLSEQINLAQETASRADEERASLVAQLSAYQAISADLGERIAEYERQLLVLQPRLPETLQRELAPRLSRLESQSQASGVSLGERMQLVAGLLSEIDAFDSSVVLTTEIVPIGSNGDTEVRVLYLGLSRAFYVNENETSAGIGIPGAVGWEWEQNNELGSEIADAIDVFETRVSPQLVQLPMQVRQ